MIINYIKSLIDTHSRVIIPDLGAFMLKGDSSKVVYFNEFLRFNDGLLVDYIAEKEKIDKIEAVKKVKAFADNVNKQLSNNKSFELEGLGTLYLDTNEKIQLKTSESITPPSSKPIEPENETAPREILFELEKTEPAPVQSKIQEPAPVSEPKPQATSTHKPKAGSVIEPPVKEAKPAATSQGKPKEAQHNADREKRIQPTLPPKKKDDVIDVVPTTARKMVIVGIVGVLVIGAIIYFAFFYSQGKDSNVNLNIIGVDSSSTKKDTTTQAKPEVTYNKAKVSQSTEIKHKEPAKTETQAKVTADNKSKITTAPKVEAPKSSLKATAGRKYYVIAGTFSVESNADRMLKKLKEQGYTPDKIRNDVKNVFYVSFASFVDKASATQEIKKLKDAGTQAWIYSN